MIVCKQCGHHNEDIDTFCGSCGKFLEWTGERVAVAEPEPPPPPPAPEPEPDRLGFMDRVKQAVGIEEDRFEPSSGEPAPAATEPVATPPVAAPITTASPIAAAPIAAAPIAAAPIAAAPIAVASSPAASPALSRPELVSAPPAIPASAAPAPIPAADEPMSRRPTSVAPAISRPRPGPRVVEAPTRRRPGDLICGQCGEGNDPERHFCRRCGNSLDEALAVRLPWYRRLFSRLFHPRTREAGWRPQRVGPPNVLGMVFRVVRLAIVALLLVGLLAFLLIPPFHNLVVDRATAAFTAVRKIVHPNYDPIHPTGASASTSIAGHPANLATDNANNTYWAASPSDKAPDLIVNFGGPVDLAEIGFTSGASGTAPADQFVNQPRPKQVHLVFSDASTTDITLKDDSKPVFYPINAKQVTFVQIHVMSTYLPEGASPSSVAITEVEFKTKD